MNARGGWVLVASLVLGHAAPAAAAEPLSPQELLALGRADLFAQQGRWEAAAVELGRLPRDSQQNPAVRQYVARTFSRLYGPEGAEGPPLADRLG
ncbi:MAG: hypothetical protein HY600_06805, partial [Candidatus Omnitrophica bacterium]|nr:hypothetical protein [Candidatus Omnitrophota bacterium]